MGGMAPHTHDAIDWADRLPALRRADELQAPVYADIATRLVAPLGPRPVIVDVGCGAGGMSSAFAAALARRGGGTLVLADAVPELLDTAQTVANAAVARAAGPRHADSARAQAELDAASSAASVGRVQPGPDAIATSAASVAVDRVQADVASVDLDHLVPKADLVWASSMVHHLPDQQAGVAGLVTALMPGGVLALVEGSPPTFCLPWDLGLGAPGLERRMLAARDQRFEQMRAEMAGAARMPYGWNVALHKAGLERVGAFSFLVDRPAPPDQTVRDYVVEHVSWLYSDVAELLSQNDRDVLNALLDPADESYLGRRDDIFVLGVKTIHFGFRR